MRNAAGASRGVRCQHSGGADLAERTCSIEGCERSVIARGWCSAHYQRWKAHGDPTGGRVSPLKWPDNLLTRMEHQPNGCIWFTGQISAAGYGRVWTGDTQSLAHRAAYEFFVGAIPEGMTIDHECHNRSGCAITDASCPHRRCVNPAHLAVKTIAENTKASPNTTAGRTHCKRGHEFTEENTYLYPDGRRNCRACKRESDHKTRTEKPRLARWPRGER